MMLCVLLNNAFEAIAMDAQGGHCSTANTSMPLSEYACQLQDSLSSARAIMADNKTFINIEVTFQAINTDGDT